MESSVCRHLVFRLFTDVAVLSKFIMMHYLERESRRKKAREEEREIKREREREKERKRESQKEKERKRDIKRKR